MHRIKNGLFTITSFLLIIIICIAIDSSTRSGLTTLLTQSQGIKVFSPERGIEATMISMGYPPYAISNKQLYSRSVSTPKLPENIIDLGSKIPPNNEAMSQVELDLILDTDFYLFNRSLYSPDIPLRTIDFGQNEDNIDKLPEWSTYSAAVTTIGQNIHQHKKAEQFIEDSRNRIIEAGSNVQKQLGHNRKILVVELWDARQIVAVAVNNPIALATDMMGLDFVSMGEATQYGYASVPMHTLYELPVNTCLIIKKPIVEMTKRDIINSLIWQQSTFSQPDACVYLLDPVWTRGGIQSMLTFAENLEKAVATQHTNEYSYEYVTQIERNR